MNMPKMSLGSWAFSFGPFEKDPWDFDPFLKYAAEYGFDGVEINGFRPHPHPDEYNTPEKCRDLVKKISDFGLGISGYAPSFEDVPPAEVEQEEYLKEIRKSIFFCENCGIDTLRVDTMTPWNGIPEGDYDMRFAKLVKTWRAAADECKKSGIKLIWEFEPGFWLTKPSEVKRLHDEIGSTNFKILFDACHAYMGAVVASHHVGEKEILKGGVAEYAALLGDAIGHVHLIDSDGTLHGDETSTHAPFGTGHIDFIEALMPIRNLALSMEWWTADFCFWAGAVEAAKEAADYMRDIAKNLSLQTG